MQIREAQKSDSAAIAKVQVDSWRTTYEGIVPDSYLAKLSYEERELKWREFFSAAERTRFALVAEDIGGQIVGFASGGPNRDATSNYSGELYAIYLLEGYQRQGAGRGLANAVAERLLQEGMNSMLVWVLTQNPACEFYEALGGQRAEEKEIVIGGATLIEVAYIWKELGGQSSLRRGGIIRPSTSQR